MAWTQNGNDSAAQKTSAIGRLLRRLADFFDRAPIRFRVSLFEINAITFLLTFIGILALGLAIHGGSTWFYLLLFALLFNLGMSIIFASANWPKPRRTAFVALLTLLAIPAASNRLLPALAVTAISAYLASLAVKEWELPHSFPNVLLVLLFCYISYDIFSLALQWQRNRTLVSHDQLPLSCSWQREHGLTCAVESTAFVVPEFWRSDSTRYLLADLGGIIDWLSFSDSATDNRIAFAVFRSPPAAVMRTLTDYFNVQRAYLRSKATTGKLILPQGILKSRDSELYAVSYRSPNLPGYLGSFSDRNALLFLHQPQLSASTGRDTTWLFVIDGTDLAAREFLLNRIVTGFRRLP